ncbi:Imm8 family immunity protein [Brenneria tiliae]|uniref:Imm8 family immunity protein n=1 Tax=Brenneria tiliae TaxID=2914984 RepID=UPI003D16279D
MGVQALSAYKEHKKTEAMRHTLLVRKYDLDEITKIITDYIDQCEGKDWRLR